MPGSLYAICKAHHRKIGGLLGWHARSHACINLRTIHFNLKNNVLAQVSFPNKYIILKDLFFVLNNSDLLLEEFYVLMKIIMDCSSIILLLK